MGVDCIVIVKFGVLVKLSAQFYPYEIFLNKLNRLKLAAGQKMSLGKQVFLSG